MSAFAGFVSFDSFGVPSGTEERITRSLEAVGSRRQQVRRCDNGVFVFRQRIVAPEDRFERQPSVGDGGVVSLFDGRLDNRAELLDALGLNGSAGSPLPDGELVRAAYERWEEDAVPRLLGDFAWAVWNGRARRLMLARDHSWHRTLYYAHLGRSVAFATGYRPLLALPEVSREIDELGLAGLLLLAPEEGERTYYKAISWVGSAVRVVASDGVVRRDRFWEPRAGAVPDPRSPEECAEAGRALFDEAVACRLRVDGPVVASVSGGLDSSAVAATAARLRVPAAVHGLCLVPVDGTPAATRPGWYPFERPYVDALAALHSNLRVEYLASIEPEAFERDPTGLFLANGAPYMSPGNTGWFLRLNRRAAELGASTILKGIMGNGTFSAHGLGRLSVLRQSGAWGAFAWELLKSRPWMPDGTWSGMVRYHIRKALPPQVDALLNRMRHGTVPLWHRNFVINPDFFNAAGLSEFHDRYSFGANDTIGPGSRIGDLRTLIMRSRLPVEAEAANRTLSGVTTSDPFSDRRILDFCASLPEDQFLRNGQTRALARRVFADRLPAAIIDNPRRGTQNGDWYLRLAPLREHFAAELDRMERSALASRLLDVPRMRRILDTWPADAEEALRTNWLGRHRFFRALHAGQFILWLEGGNQ